MILTIGTRASLLALWQARRVQSLLVQAHPGIEVKLLEITTQGDRITDRPLSAVGGKGLFVKEIEHALLDGHADLAVHSSKDMPSELPPGLVLSTFLPRADPRDVLVCREPGLTLDTLPQGARVGTSSLRRRAQLLAQRPDLQVITLRGNLDTRLAKVARAQDGLDAAVLAKAGIDRLERTEAISEVLSTERFLPAVGQGAIVIERRQDDSDTARALEPLHHAETAIAVRAERAFLSLLEGSCHVPLAGYAQVDGDHLSLRGFVGSLDGTERIEAELSGSISDPEALGRLLGQQLLDRGARRLMDAAEAS